MCTALTKQHIIQPLDKHKCLAIHLAIFYFCFRVERVAAKGLVGKLPGNPASCPEEPCNSDPQHVLYALKWTSLGFGVILLLPLLMYYMSKLISKIHSLCFKSEKKLHTGSGAADDGDANYDDDNDNDDPEDGQKSCEKKDNCTSVDLSGQKIPRKHSKQTLEGYQKLAYAIDIDPELHLNSTGASINNNKKRRFTISAASNTGKGPLGGHMHQATGGIKMDDISGGGKSALNAYFDAAHLLGSAATGGLSLSQQRGQVDNGGNGKHRFDRHKHRQSLFVNPGPGPVGLAKSDQQIGAGQQRPTATDELRHSLKSRPGGGSKRASQHHKVYPVDFNGEQICGNANEQHRQEPQLSGANSRRPSGDEHKFPKSPRGSSNNHNNNNLSIKSQTGSNQRQLQQRDEIPLITQLYQQQHHLLTLPDNATQHHHRHSIDGSTLTNTTMRYEEENNNDNHKDIALACDTNTQQQQHHHHHQEQLAARLADRNSIRSSSKKRRLRQQQQQQLVYATGNQQLSVSTNNNQQLSVASLNRDRRPSLNAAALL